MPDAPGTAIWDERVMGGPPPPSFTGRVNTYGPKGGRYHHYQLDGEVVEGVTTIMGKGISKGDILTRWAANKVSAAAVDSVGYWRKLERQDAISYLKNSPWRERDESGARGTAVHEWAEQWAATGEPPDPGDVDPIIRGQVEAFGRFCLDYEPRILVSEAVIFNRAELYAGTCDAIMELSIPGVGRQLAIVDYKTAKSVYPEVCLQLAAYRYGDFYMTETGDRVGLPGVDAAYVVHLPAAGGYALVPMQADRAMYRVFLHAKALAHFSDHGKVGVGKPLSLEVAPDD